jgi:hypothetical protein
VLEDVPRVIRWTVISGIRRGIPSDEHARFVILTKDAEQWKRFVSFKTDDEPYLLILDESGNIRARVAGEKTTPLLKQLAQELDGPPPQAKSK